MILFQIANFNLFYHLSNYKYSIQEELATFSLDSSYIEGDYRTYKNRNKKVVISISGRVKSQHFIHSLREISENDEGVGDTKCFWFEKYTEINPDYQALLSDSQSSKYQYRLYFGYCYIDIVAINPFKLANHELEYDVKFNISLVYPNTFEITNSNNGFFVTDKLLRGLAINIYDSANLYDGLNLYDNLINGLVIGNSSLQSQADSLDKWYKLLTCCGCDEHNYIQYFDNVIKPFALDNYTNSQGLLSKSVTNNPVDFVSENINFLQIYIGNPFFYLSSVPSSTQTNLEFNRDLINNPYAVGNLKTTTNTWTTNAIIQIFRSSFSNSLIPASGVPILNLFDTLGQKISIAIKDDSGFVSNLMITCNSIFIRDNLKLLVIHPHNQKIYGSFSNKVAYFSSTTFSFGDNGINLIDLEDYLLDGQLLAWNNMTTNAQDWFRLSPRYQKSIYQKKGGDSVEFTTTYLGSPNQALPANTAMWLQIYSLNENKLI